MSYYSNIPQASDDPSVSQGEILTNFGSIGSQFAVNHVPLGSVSNAGKHNFCELINQASDPSTSASEASFYSKAVTRSAVTSSQLFTTPDATGDIYQLSTMIHASKALFGLNTNNYNGIGTKYTGGWTFLPGGLIYQYGLYDAGVGGLAGSGTITFPVPFVTTFVVIPQLICKAEGTTKSDVTLSVTSGTVGTTSFSWNMNSGSTSAYTGIYWFAIGN